MPHYFVTIELTPTSFSAYSPDLPGCVAVGADREEVVVNMKEADGLPVPEPATDSEYVEVAA